MFSKKLRQPLPSATSTRFDRWSQADLVNLIEAEMTRTGELFRGLSHSEIDQGWLLQEMALHTQAVQEAIAVLQRKVAVVQSI